MNLLTRRNLNKSFIDKMLEVIEPYFSPLHHFVNQFKLVVIY